MTFTGSVVVTVFASVVASVVWLPVSVVVFQVPSASTLTTSQASSDPAIFRPSDLVVLSASCLVHCLVFDLLSVSCLTVSSFAIPTSHSRGRAAGSTS
ncbi:hypothetical protein UK12_14410 [Saccharothrix sp. ST-888]|nr:hypothetical protein UK12_14410 [Saccharothrix sp. ST-888]